MIRPFVGLTSRPMAVEVHPKGINIIGDSTSKVIFHSLNSLAYCTHTNLIVGVPLQVSSTHLGKKKNQPEANTSGGLEDRKTKTEGVTLRETCPCKDSWLILSNLSTLALLYI